MLNRDATPRRDVRADALAALRAYGPMKASALGWELWGGTTESPGRGEGSHANNKFCRSAGKLLRALEAQGKVVSLHQPGGVFWSAA